jgi:hypothetical protein
MSSVPITQSENAVANTARSTTAQNVNADQEVLGGSEPMTDQTDVELSQPAVTTTTESSNKQMQSLTEAVASLNAAIRKININERDMKTVLQQTKTVLENKLSEMEQRMEEADNIVSNVNNASQSLVQLQMKYPWLQVKLRQPPTQPAGACSLCQRHYVQIRSHRGYSSMQNWVDCSVVLDSNHRAQKITSHEQSECHKICVSAEEKRKRNAIQSSFLINKQRENEVTERFLLRCYGLIQCHVAYNRYPYMSYLHHLQGVEVGNRHLTDMAMASATDCIYDVQLRSLIKYIVSENPTTGRLRHCHLSMDKVTAEHVTRQVINIRMLDNDGEPVCINGNQSVISRHEDPLPEYTQSLGDTPVADHASDARGVFCHVLDFLKKDLKMSEETIGKSVTSSSTDCEAVYTGDIQGWQRLWKVKFNCAHLHFADRAHKLESMVGKIRKQPDFKWLDDVLSKLDSLISKICQSPKQHRNLRYTASLSESVTKTMKRLVETRFIRYLVGSIDALLTNAYVLELMWQEQSAGGDMDVQGHLKNLVNPLFLPTLVILADVFSQSAFASETAQSDIYPLWDDKANVDKFLCNIKRMNELPVLENPLNRRLRLHHPSIATGHFTPDANKPDQQVNIMQYDVRFQPRLRNQQHRQQELTPEDIIETVEVRVKQLTSAILREGATFLAQGEQERDIVKMFDLKSFDFHDPGSLSQQFNDEFVSVASHLNKGTLLFPRNPCSPLCGGVKCLCLLNQFKTFKERVRDNKDRFRGVWFVVNETGQVKWNITTVLSYFHKIEYALHEDIPDLAEIIEICLVMSRSQSDTERAGKLMKDVSDKRFGGKFNEAHHEKGKRDRVNEETFLYGNSVPLHSLPLRELSQE